MSVILSMGGQCRSGPVASIAAPTRYRAMTATERAVPSPWCVTGNFHRPRKSCALRQMVAPPMALSRRAQQTFQTIGQGAVSLRNVVADGAARADARGGLIGVQQDRRTVVHHKIELAIIEPHSVAQLA